MEQQSQNRAVEEVQGSASPVMNTRAELEEESFQEIEKLPSDDQGGLAQARFLRESDIRRRRISPHRLLELLARGYVLQLRRSWRGEIPRFLLLILAALGSLYLMATAPIASLIALGLPLVMPLTVLMMILHRKYNRRYVITAKEVSVSIGFIALTLTEMRCTYDRFKAVEIQRTILQRILGVGDIKISTLLIDQPELELAGLNNPIYYATILRLKIPPQPAASFV